MGCHPLREVPSLRRRGSTRGPLSAGFRRALTQATHYSTIMHDLLFARASINRASLTAQAVRRRPHDQHHQQADVRQYFGPAFLVDGSSLALASPRLMNGATRPGEKTLAQASVLVSIHYGVGCATRVPALAGCSACDGSSALVHLHAYQVMPPVVPIMTIDRKA